MLSPGIFFLLLQGAAEQAPVTVEGRGAPTVQVPRVAEAITIDGTLGEPAWRRAARLVGFHQYQPVDGLPADERTEVLVFYTPTSIVFGIVAHANDPSTVRAKLSDRDNIGNDDRVTIYLDTFNDRRRAFFFGVNPLGVQQDGVRTEGAASAGQIFGGNVDYSPDFRFESKGQPTDSGYVIELRIPFESLRFPGGDAQRWGINVVRNVASSGKEDTWTDARRASNSFLAQAGTLEGITDIDRGIVTEAQPFVTATRTGVRQAPDGRYVRDDVDTEVGANVRVAFPQVSLDATINPDFSQVESDAGLVRLNERFELFVSEKRPFFLEGIELFNTPNQLIYSRRIVNPTVGGKVTGKLGRFSFAHLTAFDDVVPRSPTAPGDGDDDARFNITRLRADLGGASTAGLTVTDRRQAGDYNTVAAADARIVFARLYYFEGQIGQSSTRRQEVASPATTPALVGRRDRGTIWKAELDRTGRTWGFNYVINALDDEFRTDAGFVPRTGIVTAHAFNRFSYYGAKDASVQNITAFFGPTRVWRHDRFSLGRDAIEGEESFTGIVTLRGGWNVELGASRNFFSLDGPSPFSVRRPDGTLVAYQPPEEISGLLGGRIQLRTPVYPVLNAAFTLERNEVPIFIEGSEGREMRATASINLRPTVSLRIEGTGVVSRITRAGGPAGDGEFARTIIPRLKAEYQPARSLFFRIVSEYRAERIAALRDARTGAPLYIVTIGQPATPVGPIETGALRTDWLISYEPTPGTVAFLGYGNTLGASRTSRLSALEQMQDGIFLKLAYQFRW